MSWTGLLGYGLVSFSSVQSLSCVWLLATSWTAACQASLSITNSWSLLKFMSMESVMPFSISSSIVHFSSCLQSVPHQGLFKWVCSSHQVAKVLAFQLQHQSFQWIFRTDFLQDWLVWSPWSPRDSQESTPVPQFESVNSLAHSFLYHPVLICTWLLEKP